MIQRHRLMDSHEDYVASGKMYYNMMVSAL